MRFSEAKGRKVVSTATAATAGKVDDVVIDTPSARIVAVKLKHASGDADTLLWPSIASFGGDAVTITGEDVLVKPDQQLDFMTQKKFALHGKRVLTQTGIDLGEVKDFDFDPDSGAIRALLLRKNGEIAGSRLVATGSYAVVVTPDPAV